MKFNWPLMEDNITKEDIDTLIDFLKEMPRLTQSENVKAFEREWCEWLGVKYSVFVNSGSSANFITMAAIKHLHGVGDVIVPPLTWVSDIVSVFQNGFKPVFVDINPRNLCMDDKQVIAKLTDKTKAVFLTHVQGFNGLTDRLLETLKDRDIPLIEDVCESHGATFKGKKLGTFGFASNFSFYFAHHMSTVEGGMVCTNDRTIYETARMLRSHGMVREIEDISLREKYIRENPELSPDFIFALPAYNMRNTEIGAVLGRSQLRRLDENNVKRRRNFESFLKNLDPTKYRTDFDLEGSCNYAFNLVLKKPDSQFRDKVEKTMQDAGVEFRRGSSGGGNQLRQPYLRNIIAEKEWENYPNIEHVHFYGYYIGNYPDLDEQRILDLCSLLNSVDSGIIEVINQPLLTAKKRQHITTKKSSDEQISILIPTLNRSEFLIRALSYYGKVGFKGYICIGDSSDAQHSERIKCIVNALEDKLNIIYKYFPKPSYDVQTCFKELIEIAPTSYLVFSGDDDLLIPRSLGKCARFLQEHPDYSAAHGLRLVFHLKKNGPYGEITKTEYSQQHIWESEKAADRWAEYMRYAASTQYYVHHKTTWKRMYKDVSSISMQYLGPELLPCSISAISGKVKQLECLSTVFQVLEEKSFSWDKTSIFDLAIDMDWSKAVQIVRKSVTNALMRVDGISEKRSIEIFDREFWRHIALFFNWQYRKRYNQESTIQNEKNSLFLTGDMNIYDLMIHPSWSETVGTLRRENIDALARKERISNELSREKIDKRLWDYILLLLIRQYTAKFGSDSRPLTKEMESQWASADRYRKMFSLEMLMKPSSVFSEDVFPVLKIISAKGAQTGNSSL
ncbi:MAG: DegT/DnrJ/EryC1/StrS family aminotransferase [Desulfobacteraceae bacterium]|nr:DegT/DnrJ/EryC1/StrS family aminotransferase [Desulfobacteraceae bacterium]